MDAVQGMLARAAAYGAGEGQVSAQTWVVHMRCGSATLADRPEPNLSWDDWMCGRYATLPRGALLRCVEADAADFRWDPPGATADAIARAYDVAFSAAVDDRLNKEEGAWHYSG